ncbi:2'-5' RNA ligase family protein [Dactylosporangium aurantiacum]|uniref:2'-5' RNA ligase family protein n=1 Tax=Dactylosporangium aurantiacum TaxID=35754 RepID=A0A9Q9IJ19_9ACTN|nr:2'-5' RNA ligase family protein [Dactylosporangium aurantiacum]MDG6105622.1 2'-5' RNA ligase family protein [Dactylosporangium aurantiacum]UWZ57044.1 2'-5' RNA ligase family protein [Dactylosporangium aurantiacum]
MRTVELLPDDRLDAHVRALWRRLRDAGLPSLAGHPHPTNRPHLTVVTAPALDVALPLPLPLLAEVGPVRFLGRALVLEVAATDGLRAVHAACWSALDDAWPGPGEWLPHVSLALNVRPSQRDRALRELGDVRPVRGRFTAARSYDTRTRTVTGLPG